MQLRIDKTLACRDTDGRLCGVYHYDDPFKSYFGELYTPGGKNVVALPPVDPPHHKGLQFGLCTADVNFWEEDTAHEPDGRKHPIGKQHTLSIAVLPPDAGVGFVQEIEWITDKETSFHETRTITLEKVAGAYRWTWRTTLVAAREKVSIITSLWPDGVGYCGLGLRLAGALFEDGQMTPAGMRCGDIPTRVVYQGAGAEVRFEQDAHQQNALFVSSYRAPPGFAFMSLGPSNLTPCEVAPGHRIEGRYIIEVADR